MSERPMKVLSGEAIRKSRGQVSITRATTSALLGLLFAGTATAQSAVTDCPLRDQPFSIDLPLIDILSSPAAVAAIEREAPSLLQGLPPQMLKPEAPSFSALMSVRKVASMRRLTPEELAKVDEALAALPVTPDDQARRCARYDNDEPQLTTPEATMHVLVFTKINGFDHGEGVPAATAAIEKLAARHGWGVAVTDKAGVFTPERLAEFDVIVWNNVSGDVLTLAQRRAFKDYIENGGGFVGIHGAGGDPVYFWDWYANELLAARFIGHPADPQFQTATLQTERSPTGVGSSLPQQWTLSDEWYSFVESPRQHGASVAVTLDESSYEPIGYGGQDLRMGDHPIAWTRCVNDGRSFYSALGHRPETYNDANHLALLADGLRWAGGQGTTACSQGEVVRTERAPAGDGTHMPLTPDDMATGQGATGVGASTLGSDAAGALEAPRPEKAED